MLKKLYLLFLLFMLGCIKKDPPKFKVGDLVYFKVNTNQMGMVTEYYVGTICVRMSDSLESLHVREFEIEKK